MEPHSKSLSDIRSATDRDAAFSSKDEDPAPARELRSKDSTPAYFHEKSAASPQDAPLATPSFLQVLGKLFRGAPIASTEVEPRRDTTLKETLESLLLEHEKEGQEIVIVPEERSMLSNILRFGEMTVSDIMIPRPDIVAVEYGISLEELKQMVVREQHSRMPVYTENLDNVAGFLHIKDLAVQVFEGKPFSMDTSIRQILFVPPSMKVMDLLIKMRLSSVHIAIVVDEYGGTDGLVSMEDIVEEIVGEIQDEHDDEEAIDDFIWVDSRIIEADGRMTIEDLEKCFGPEVVLHEDGEDIDTVGGLVFSHLGHVPSAGEEFDYPTGLRITVLEAESRTVKRVRIERLDNSPEETKELLAVR